MGCRRSVSGGGAWLCDGKQHDDLREKLVSFSTILWRLAPDTKITGLMYLGVRPGDGKR